MHLEMFAHYNEQSLEVLPVYLKRKFITKFPENEKKRLYLDHQKWVKKDKYPYHESDKSEAPEN